MSIITGISDETTNELTIYAISFRNVTIFYRQRISFFILSACKIERVQEFRINFSSSCFIADDSHVKIT